MLHVRRNPIINWPVLLRVIGWLLMIESVFMLMPFAACLYYGEADWLPFLASSALTGVVGAVLSYRIHPTFHHIGKRDGFLLTASVWVFFSLFGMLPFLISTMPISLSDAFFEAMSGFTTTGSTVLTDVSDMSHGIHLWRALMQWIGGMGIILFTLAILPMLNHSGGMQMFNAEVTGITHDKIRPRISQTAKALWTIYIVLTLVLILLLWLGPMSLFESVCHAFGAISTGGYSTANESIAAWHSNYIKIVLIVFMFLGGVNFGLIYKCITGKVRDIWRNDVFRTYVSIIAVALAIFSACIYFNNAGTGFTGYFIDPLFQIVSTITSTGFTVANFESWGSLVIAITFVLMFSGACAGSTSGGAKIDRMLYLFKNAGNEIYRCIYPNAIRPVIVSGKVINSDLVSKVIAFLCIYMLSVVFGGIALTACGVPIIDAFFSAFSCLSNTGLGAGVTGYGGSYDLLPDLAKWILSLLMLIGRLEIFTMLVLFLPSFWRH